MEAEIACPGCEHRFGLGTRTMGDWIECPQCRLRFQAYLVGTIAHGDLRVETVAREGPMAAPGPRVLQRFEVLGELGRGGQGVVYRVRPRSGHAIDYALKYLDARPMVTGLTGSTEQEVGALLDHPNLVRLFASGYDVPEGAHPAAAPVGDPGAGGLTHQVDELRKLAPGALRPYAVFELVEGTSLRKRIEAGLLTLQEVLEITLQLLSGLESMHRAGIVHRDLKPENILIGRSGQAKITDYGIGCFLKQGQGGEEPFSGTPGYAAPEQFLGKPGRPAGDLYSLGVTLYEMLVGERPFPTGTISQLARAHLETVPADPRTRRAEIPEGLARLTLACLEKDPAKRPSSADSLREALLVEAQKAKLTLPLTLVEHVPVPRSMASAEGLRLAGGRLALAMVLLSAPAWAYVLWAFTVTSLESFAWIAPWGLVVAAGIGLRKISDRSGIPINLPAYTAAAEGNLAFVLIYFLFGVFALGFSLLILFGGYTLRDLSPPFVMAGGVLFLGILAVPPVVGWIRQGLLGADGQPVPPGKARLLLESNVTMRAKLGEDLPLPLPARLSILPGKHQILLFGGGGSTLFETTIERPGCWRATFGTGSGGPIPGKPVPPDEEDPAIEPVLVGAVLASFLAAYLVMPPVISVTEVVETAREIEARRTIDVGVLADRLLAGEWPAAQDLVVKLDPGAPEKGSQQASYLAIAHAVLERHLPASETETGKDWFGDVNAAVVDDPRYIALAYQHLVEKLGPDGAWHFLELRLPVLEPMWPEVVAPIARVLAPQRLPVLELSRLNVWLPNKVIHTLIGQEKLEEAWGYFLALDPGTDAGKRTFEGYLPILCKKEADRGAASVACDKLKQVRVIEGIRQLVEDARAQHCRQEAGDDDAPE